MVCEADFDVVGVLDAPPFSSLFIGMVCEAPGAHGPRSWDPVFQFPLYRDGV